MIQIIDRRFDSKNKSSVNRSRFLRRYKGQIRKAVSDVIDRDGIRDMDKGKKISIPGKDISEPQFSHGPGGKRERVHSGNDRFATGDEVDRPPPGGQGAGGQASPDGEGMDSFEFTLSRDEFLEIFFEELDLPHLVKRHLASIKEYKRVRAGYTQTGVPTNINLVRTMRGATGRRIASRGPYGERLKELEEALRERRLWCSENDAGVQDLLKEINRIKARVRAIPFIDTFDLRYNNRVKIAQPTTQAVMFCLMDVSGSMDEEKKSIAKRFFTLLYLFLVRNYERIDVVFIRHHTQAEEVDEERFFHSRETGGTIVSSALRLMVKVAAERYPASLWNIYGAQASDGDNWSDDSEPSRDLLGDEILPYVQHFAYIEIAREPQILWREYEKLMDGHPDSFAMRRIKEVTDIYPVFHELFRKRV
jgi:uncharacterized sporulation protein YeaH/YhbH (DUF444 family)